MFDHRARSAMLTALLLMAACTAEPSAAPAAPAAAPAAAPTGSAPAAPAAAATAPAAAPTGGSAAGAVPALQPLTYGYTALGANQWALYAALARGYMTQQGIDLDESNMGSAAGGVQALASGSLDVTNSN